VHEVGGRTEISRLRQAIGHSADRADFSINEIVWQRDHGMRVNGPERPRNTRRCCELMIVIGRSLMGMAVEHRLDGVMVVMSFDMVAMLMESEGEDRHAAHHPQ